jgi:glutaminyl-tRNA synthetase
LRRRGVPPKAIKSFCAEVGYTKTESTNEWALLEYHVRQELNDSSPRCMAVLKPILVEVANWADDRRETGQVPLNPQNPEEGMRQLEAGKLLYIDADDFMEEPPKKFFRLRPGGEVRLRGLGYLRCDEIIKDADGNIERLICAIDEDTLHGGAPADGRKVKATIHWVDTATAVEAEVRLFDHLFTSKEPLKVDEGQDWMHNIDANSCTVTTAKIPPFLAEVKAGYQVQFERLGYFCADDDHAPENPVFNRTTTLRDAWAKAQKK